MNRVEQQLEETSLPLVPAPVLPRPPTLDERRVQAFLDQMVTEEMRRSPHESRCDVAERLHAELETRIQTHQELGSTQHEAIDLAFAQMRRNRAAALQTTLQTAKRNRTAVPIGRATAVMFGQLALFYALVSIHANHNFGAVLGIDGTTLTRLELIGMPLLAGVSTGLFVRGAGFRSSLRAIELVAIYALLVPSAIVGLQGVRLVPNDLPWNWLPNPLLPLYGITWWLVCGAAGSIIGSRLRQLAVAGVVGCGRRAFRRLSRRLPGG